MTDEEAQAAALADPDAPPLDEDWFARAVVVPPKRKQSITLRIDSDVLEFFRAGGQGYQSRMNAVLRAYKEYHAG
ncbi:MAG TPA: BrnA antitoxin family protein [Gemmatimonadaceae bacterium]|nr:BrnA antitoxin family protein [Gemmatimonadaceae bacterium]